MTGLTTEQAHLLALLTNGAYTAPDAHRLLTEHALAAIAGARERIATAQHEIGGVAHGTQAVLTGARRGLGNPELAAFAALVVADLGPIATQLEAATEFLAAYWHLIEQVRHAEEQPK